MKFHGFISRGAVKKVLERSKIGLVTLHPTQSYLEALPVKMFEYMAAGIPVIASDFPLYKEILKDCDCAVFVDPLNPKAIAQAVSMLLNNESKAQEMGINGKKAVLEHFNWAKVEEDLYSLYKELE